MSWTLTPRMASSKLGTYPIPHQNQKDKIKDFSKQSSPSFMKSSTTHYKQIS